MRVPSRPTTGPVATAPVRERGARASTWLLGPSRAARWRRLTARRVGATLLVAGALTWLVAAPRGSGTATRPAVVAVRAVPAGHVVDTDAVAVRAVPDAVLPTGSLDSPAPVVGRRAVGAIEAGEVLTAARVVGPGALDQLPRGRRALTLPALDPGAVAMIQPGDRVDVHRPGAGRPLATDVLVLGRSPVEAEPSGPFDVAGAQEASLVVAVDPQAAQRLASGPVDATVGGGYAFAARARK